jgi:hypothetical protein
VAAAALGYVTLGEAGSYVLLVDGSRAQRVPRLRRGSARMRSRDERDALEHFEERYAVPDSAVTAEIERRVIGAVWGANGYTTLDQADELARRLALGPGRRVLDVGTGRGWPGLYFAVR